jgi:ABC-type phosphate transport system substrate-binding protein
MRIGKHLCVLCISLLLTPCFGVASEAKQLAVIVDKSNNVSGMTAVDLTKMFKFESHKWPDGRNVIVVLRDPTSPEMQTAIQKLYHMQPEEFKALLAAHQTAVVIVHSEEELLKSVQSIPGAVGLVDVYSINSGVNVLKVDGKLPLEPGYFLKGN